MRLVPVTRESHYGKCLRPVSSFAYAAANSATEVVLGEISQVAACFPMFFTRQGNQFHLVALMGLAAGENLFVDSSGVWTTSYVPAALRAYPFLLGANPSDGQPTVMIDEDAGLLSEAEGEPLFGTGAEGADGPLGRALRLLTQMSLEVNRTGTLITQLEQYGLLRPAAQGGAEGGLLTVDEAALNALGDEQFLALRRSGALAVAYGQMFSQAQLAQLQARANQRARARGAAMPS